MTIKPVSVLNVFLAHEKKRLPVGRLALQNRRVWFQYDESFITRGLELSPFKLPLKQGVVACEDRIFDGLFGLFNDSLPDGWGRLLLDRYMRLRGIAPENLTVLDRLAHVGGHGMGALTY
jgi:serine/threonine-protein kinase HipA